MNPEFTAITTSQHDWDTLQQTLARLQERISILESKGQQETAVPEGFYQKSDNHLPEPLPESYRVDETTTSEQTPDVDALLALVKDYYAAALLGEQLTDPTHDEERAFQARMIGLVDRTEKLLDLWRPHEQKSQGGSSNPELYRQFLEDTVDDSEYNAYLEHIHTPTADEY